MTTTQQPPRLLSHQRLQQCVDRITREERLVNHTNKHLSVRLLQQLISYSPISVEEAYSYLVFLVGAVKDSIRMQKQILKEEQKEKMKKPLNK